MTPLEIDSFPALEALLQTQPSSLQSLVFQGLDLRSYSERFCSLPVKNCQFLGCHLEPRLAAWLAGQGCLLIPPIEDKVYTPFRVSLYSVEELYQGMNPSYRHSLDYRIYQTFRDPEQPNGPLRPVLVDEQLARRIHDNSISDALEEFLAGFPHRSLVAIMGGHALERDQPLYAEIAHFARQLRRAGLLLASGGGPGLMEATNLGAYLAPYPDQALTTALDLLAQAPSFKPTKGEQSGLEPWLQAGFQVRQLLPPREGGESLGIPTWFYGHEPPNVFASHIAKYFENSLREEGLLALALGGILFAPGGAGTIQEIFQDACQNYYTTYQVRSPMLFYPRHYWTETFPVFPLMEKLAEKGNFLELIQLCDHLDQAQQVLLSRAAIGEGV